MEIIDDVSNFVTNNAKNISFIAQLAEKGAMLIGLTEGMKQSESYKFSNKITSITLENGAEISDHIITGPVIITQSFIVTSLVLDKYSHMVMLSSILFLLNGLRKSKSLITVLTSHGIYKNMTIQEINAKKQEDVKSVLICEIVFKEIVFADVSNSKVKSTNIVEKMAQTKNKTFNIASSAVKNAGHINAF